MKLLKWLSVANRFTKVYLDKALEPLGINSSQHMYLLKVCGQPGISQDSLMETFYVHPSNIVRMVAALERKGFLTRVPNEMDKRTRNLYPTQKALDIAEKVQEVCEEAERFLLDGLDQESKSVFLEELLQMGERVAKDVGVVRKKDEFDE